MKDIDTRYRTLLAECSQRNKEQHERAKAHSWLAATRGLTPALILSSVMSQEP
jgi:hypothetical protein